MNRQTLRQDTLGSDQALAFEQALRSHTYEGAYAAHQENVKGSLEPGKFADLAVWIENPSTLTLGDLAMTKSVYMNSCGGPGRSPGKLADARLRSEVAAGRNGRGNASHGPGTLSRATDMQRAPATRGAALEVFAFPSRTHPLPKPAASPVVAGHGPCSAVPSSGPASNRYHSSTGDALIVPGLRPTPAACGQP